MASSGCCSTRLERPWMIPNHPAGQVRRLTVEATRTRAPAADAAMTVPHIRGFPGPVRDGISSGIHDRPPNTRLWWQRRQRTGLESPIRYRCCDRSSPRGRMAYIVDFVNVSTTGLESSPVADANLSDLCILLCPLLAPKRRRGHPATGRPLLLGE